MLIEDEDPIKLIDKWDKNFLRVFLTDMSFYALRVLLSVVADPMSGSSFLV